MVVQNQKTSEIETIVLNEQNLSEALGEPLTTEQVDTVSMMLYIKDRYDVSGRAYHQMAKICKQLPRHYRLKEKIGELNRHWNICPTPNGTVGVQQSLTDRLHIRVRKLVEVTSADAPSKVLKKVRVKLAGDGTNIGKRLHVINFNFHTVGRRSKGI